MRPLRIARSLVELVRREGVRGLPRRLARHFARRGEYRRWVEARDTLDEARRRALLEEVERLPARPRLSVLLPVFDPDERWLRRAVESVRDQLYPDWELCIADDASTRPHVRPVLQEYARGESRIKLVLRATNGHISAATNTALAQATGEFIALLDHDDELPPHALHVVARELARHPETDLLYSDEDKLDPRGRRVGGYFKPDWNPDLFRSQNLVSHLGVYRTRLVREVGGFREGFEGSQDYDLALRVSERTPHIRHVCEVLYHWRMIPGSAAHGTAEKPYASPAAVRALQGHLDRVAPGAVCERAGPFYRVRYPLPEPRPEVTLVVLGGGRDPAGGRDPWRSGGWPGECVAADPAGGRAAALNRAAAAARGGVRVFLDGAFRPAAAGWLEELVGHALRPEVGAAGGRLVARTGRVLHGGYLLALDREAPVVSAHEGFHRDDPGYLGRNGLAQNFLAVDHRCLAVRRRLFAEAGGFDAALFADALFDVDLCLRLRERGLRTVFTPFSELRQAAVAPLPRPSPAACDALRERWRDRLGADPFWHPRLAKTAGDFSIDPEELRRDPEIEGVL
jgi:O-antigen biosynthesis protein